MSTQAHSTALLWAIRELGEGRLEQARQGLEAVQKAGGPEEATATRFLAHIDITQRRYLQAASRLQAHTQQHGADARVLAQWAEVCMAMGDQEQALAHATAALELDPGNAVLGLNVASWEAGRSSDPLRIRQLHEAWASKHLDGTLAHRPAQPLQAPSTMQLPVQRDEEPAQSAPEPSRPGAPGRRLRVGYVSADLNNHAVRYLIEPYLRGHDRRRFEVHAFMSGTCDEISSILRQHVEHWHEVRSFSDAQLFERVRSLEIDILVDLSGHTEGQRLQVFAWRAAPVQLTWWGYVQTLGMREMDARLCDAYTCPPGVEAHYSEPLWRLRCFTAYQPPVDSDRVFEAPCRRNGYVTLVSLNHTRKLSDAALALWLELLHRCPQAALLIVSTEATAEGAQALMHPRLQRLGFDMQRVAVVPRLSMREFMHMASVADLSLDSMPVSGGVTTFHALWMGLPVLALRPPQPIAVQSYAGDILRCTGLHSCVAADPGAYLSQLQELVSDHDAITALREQTWQAIRASPYLQHEARVRELEQAYEQMLAKAQARARP